MGAGADVVLVAVHEDGTRTRIPYHKYETFEAPGEPSTNSSGGETLRVPRTYFRAVLDTSSPVATCFIEGQEVTLPPRFEASLILPSAHSPTPSSASPIQLGAARASPTHAIMMSSSDMLRHGFLPWLVALTCFASS